MAILWFLSCLALLSGANGQSSEVPRGNVNSVPKNSLLNKPWFIVENDCRTVFNGHYIISSQNENLIRIRHPLLFEGKDVWAAIKTEEEAMLTPRIHWLISCYQVPKATSTYRDGNSSTIITVIELSNPVSDEHAEKISIDFDYAGFHKVENCSTTKSYKTNKYRRRAPDPQWVAVPILTNDECENNWGIRTQGNKICTGLSSCMVVDGAALVCERSGTKILAGFVSSSCSKGKPAMFSHMSAFSDWMEKTIRDK